MPRCFFVYVWVRRMHWIMQERESLWTVVMKYKDCVIDLGLSG